MELFGHLAFAMLIWHALADYPLQGDFLAKAKNPNTPVPGISWGTALYMHGLIHSAGVWVITGYYTLAMIELALHCIIDRLKCAKVIDFEMDQALHIACKVGYAGYVVYMAPPAYTFLSHLR